jgi:hypothetical protein
MANTQVEGILTTRQISRRVCLMLVAIGTTACREYVATRGNEKSTPLALTREQCAAIQIAEQFVLENGYTSAPATADSSRMVWELGEGPDQIDVVRRSRHDSLKTHAYGVYSGGPEDPLAWTVTFEYTDRMIEHTDGMDSFATPYKGKGPAGRAVVVKVDAGRPWACIQHMDLILTGEPRLPSHEVVSAFCGTVEKSP